MKRTSNRPRDATSDGAAPSQQIIRCAIYGRVSTDEQAVLEYNSLQAQEDICKNYITIRAIDPSLQRKWTHVESYFDKGYSGGTLDRPELKRLLADVKRGKIEVVVAYKIDRISRSISQFYEIWKAFEEFDVDFASATQEFNTSTSQGKLMLNLLLSFAQYERELIGERTRDKIAAAKKRGRWVGGKPVLGYDVVNKALIPNEAEVPQARDLFDLYLGKVSLLRAVSAGNAKGYRTKQWTTSKGKVHGNKPFNKNSLYALLTNPVYIGKIRHHEQLYDGQHQAIINVGVFDRVQQLLKKNWGKRGAVTDESRRCFLRGLVRCAACDRAMTPKSAQGRGGRYMYYTCLTADKQGASACTIRSVSATALEKLVLQRLAMLASNEDIVNRIVAKGAAEAQAKLPLLRQDRIKLQAELTGEREQGRRLANAIADGSGSGQFVADALKGAEERGRSLEQQLADLALEVERLERNLLTPKQVCSALKDFISVWDSLNAEEQARLARLVIREIVYDRRDKSEGEIRWRFWPLNTEKPQDHEVLGFSVLLELRGGRDSNPRPPA